MPRDSVNDANDPLVNKKERIRTAIGSGRSPVYTVAKKILKILGVRPTGQNVILLSFALRQIVLLSSRGKDA